MATDGRYYQRWWAVTDTTLVQGLDASDLNGQFHDYSAHYDSATKMVTIKFTETSGKILTWTTKISSPQDVMAMIVSASTGANTNLQQFKINSFTFNQAATVDVKYVDTKGNPLAKGTVTYPNGPYKNGTYQTTQLNIAGYKFLRLDNGSATGTASIATSGQLGEPGDNGDVIYVYAPDYQAATKTINETIKYVDANGKTLAASVKGTPLTFMKVTNPVDNTVKVYLAKNGVTDQTLKEDGTPVDKNWVLASNADFAAVTNPVIDKYKVISTDAPNSDFTKVALQTVKSSDNDLNFTVVYGQAYTQTSKTVNETINYVNQAGTVIANKTTATPINFVTVTNPLDGTQITYYSTTTTIANLDNGGVPKGDWHVGNQTNFTAVAHPNIANYQVLSTDAPNSDLTQVSAQTVSPTTNDLNYTVVYGPAYQQKINTIHATINYVDLNGQPVADKKVAVPVNFLTVTNQLDGSAVTYYSTTATTATLDKNGVPTGDAWQTGNQFTFDAVTNPQVANYKIISNDGANSDLTQVGTQTVNPNSSDINITVKYAPLFTKTTKTVTETIHYLDKDDRSNVFPANTAKIYFLMVTNPVDGTTQTYYSKANADSALNDYGIPTDGFWNNSATAPFSEVTNPIVGHYKIFSNDAPNSDLTAVTKQSVTADSADLNFTVLYTKDFQSSYTQAIKPINETIHYINQNGTEISQKVAKQVRFVTIMNANDGTAKTYYSTTATTADVNADGVPDLTQWTEAGAFDFAAVLNPDITGYQVISNSDSQGDLTKVAQQTVLVNGTDLNFTVVYAPAYTQTTKTINETVNYVDQNGKVIHAQAQPTAVTFLTVTDPTDSTKTQTYYSLTQTSATLDNNGVPSGDWTLGSQHTFDAIANPTLDGYQVVSNDAPNSDLTTVAHQNVTPTNDNLNYTVVYAPVYTTKVTTINETINYVDRKGNVVATQKHATPINFVTVTNPVDGITKTYYSTTTALFTLDANGAPQGSDWTLGNQADFAAVTNPTVTNYQVISTDAKNSDLTHVGTQTVQAGDADLTLTVVYAPAYTQTPKTLHETINYIDEAGKVLAPAKQGTPINFITVTSPFDGSTKTYYSTTATTAELDDNGVPMGNAWTLGTKEDFAAVTNPAINGYRVISNDAPNSDLKHVAVQTVDVKDTDLTFNVVYQANYTTAVNTVTETINYVDQHGEALVKDYVATPITFLVVTSPFDGSTKTYISTTTTKFKLDTNGVPQMADWQLADNPQFDAIVNPQFNGYKVLSNDAPNSDLSQVSAQKVTPDSGNLNFTVIYAPDTNAPYQVATKTVRETIEYVDQNGNTLAPKYQSLPITFMTVTNVADGTKTVYATETATSTLLDPDGKPLDKDWQVAEQAQYEAVVNPTITGYHVLSNSAPDSDLTQVAAQVVTSTSDDLNFRVVYAPDEQPVAYQATLKTVHQTIHYVDQQGNKLADAYHGPAINFLTVTNSKNDSKQIYTSRTLTATTLTANGIPIDSGWQLANSADFDAVTHPQIKAFKVIKTTASENDLQRITAKTVTPANDDLDYTVVYAPAYTATTKTITETVHYVDTEGTVLATPVTNTPVHFLTVTNPTTGQDQVYVSRTLATAMLGENGVPTGDWQRASQVDFSALAHLKIPGYVVDHVSAPNSDFQQIGTQTVTPMSDNLDFTVVYRAGYTYVVNPLNETIHYVDQKGKQLAPTYGAPQINVVVVTSLFGGVTRTFVAFGDHYNVTLNGHGLPIGDGWQEVNGANLWCGHPSTS